MFADTGPRRGGIHPSFVLSGTVAALMEHSFYILVD